MIKMINNCVPTIVAVVFLLLTPAQAQLPLTVQTNQSNTAGFRFDFFRFGRAAKVRPSSFSLVPAASLGFSPPVLSAITPRVFLRSLTLFYYQ